jgi:hypothetical protein
MTETGKRLMCEATDFVSEHGRDERNHDVENGGKVLRWKHIIPTFEND